MRDLPELGRLTGRGDTLNLERLVAARPDLVIDVGTINDTYRSLADRVQAQTGIPYLPDRWPLREHRAALRLLADVLGVKERGEALAGAAEDDLQAGRHGDRRGCPPTSGRASIWRGAGRAGERLARARSTPRSSSALGAINVVEGCAKRAGW